MKKFKFLAFVAALMIAAACSEPLDEAAESAPPPNKGAEEVADNIVPDDGPIVLGDKLPNPYSMENMRKAIAELQARDLSKSALTHHKGVWQQKWQ